MRRWTFLLAAAAAATGCMTGAGQKSNPLDRSGAGARTIRIVAENRNFNQATLEAVGTVQRRIGILPGNNRRTFTMTWPSNDVLRIRIDLLAGDRMTTNAISIEPGETAYLTVQNPVQRSMLRR